MFFRVSCDDVNYFIFNLKKLIFYEQRSPPSFIKKGNYSQLLIFHHSKHRNFTDASVSLSRIKGNDIYLNDRPQIQNDTENEIGRYSARLFHSFTASAYKL